MNNIASARTQLYGIIGSPIRHSKSPTLHNLGFAEMGMDAVFLAFEATVTNVADVMNAIRVLNISGGSITMPVKEAVIPLIDRLSLEAQLIGAVNVFKNENGILTGYNTDGMGLVMLLEENNIAYKGCKVVIAGAGGAGRAAAVQVALSGAKELVIFDLTEKSAGEVAGIVNNNVKTCTARAFEADEKKLVEELADNTSVYIDCTPLGMFPNNDTAMIHDFSHVPPALDVVDIVYAPSKTRLLHLAEENGCRIFNGMDMFYHQGAEAFRILTGQQLPPGITKSNIL